MQRFNKAVLALLATAGPLPALAGPFDVGGRPPESALVMRAGAAAPAPEPSSPMLDTLAGIHARLDRGQTAKLRAATGKPAPLPEGAEPVLTLYLQGANRTDTATIYQAPGGRCFAQDTDLEKKPVYTLDADAFATLWAGWSHWLGEEAAPTADAPAKPLDAADAPIVPRTPQPSKPALVADLTPLRHGWFTMDREGLSDRFLTRGMTDVPPTARDLAKQSVRFRLPAGEKGWEPRRAVGVLIWIDPVPGEAAGAGYDPLHPALFPACDELGLIAAAPKNIGNDRPSPDRHQLVFDTLATLSERYLIDPDRVYLAGLSGGGVVSTQLAVVFPDIVKGSVPICGVATWEAIHMEGNRYWPPTLPKPAQKWLRLARQHRHAAITGSADYAQPAVVGAAKVWKSDGLTLRVFDHVGMGHTLPTPERFAEALRWVDEPARAAAAERAEKAAAALQTWKEAKHAPGSADWRAGLIEVTRIGPWSPAAWEAADMLQPTQPSP